MVKQHGGASERERWLGLMWLSGHDCGTVGWVWVWGLGEERVWRPQPPRESTDRQNGWEIVPLWAWLKGWYGSLEWPTALQPAAACCMPGRVGARGRGQFMPHRLLACAQSFSLGTSASELFFAEGAASSCRAVAAKWQRVKQVGHAGSKRMAWQPLPCPRKLGSLLATPDKNKPSGMQPQIKHMPPPAPCGSWRSCAAPAQSQPPPPSGR